MIGCIFESTLKKLTTQRRPNDEYSETKAPANVDYTDIVATMEGFEDIMKVRHGMNKASLTYIINIRSRCPGFHQT